MELLYKQLLFTLSAARADFFRGDYPAAIQSCLNSLQLAEQHNYPPPMLGIITHLLGQIALSQGDYPRASDYLVHALHRLPRGSAPELIMEVVFGLRQIYGLDERFQPPGLESDLAAHIATFQRSEGTRAIWQLFEDRLNIDEEAAREIIDPHAVDIAALHSNLPVGNIAFQYQYSPYTLFGGIPWITAVIQQRRLDNLQQAASYLAAAEEILQDAQRFGERILLMIQRGLLAWESGDENQAGDALLLALKTAGPAYHMHPFLQEAGSLNKPFTRFAPQWPTLIANDQTLSDGEKAVLKIFVEQVTARVAAINKALHGASSTNTAVAIIDLSPLELEVLHELEKGATNREIAQKLLINENTLRAHLKRIYHKLDVENRVQAITFARENKLT